MHETEYCLIYMHLCGESVVCESRVKTKTQWLFILNLSRGVSQHRPVLHALPPKHKGVALYPSQCI